MDKLTIKILKKMNIKPTEKAFDKLTKKETYKYNVYRQKFIGKKAYEYFTLNEPGSILNKIFKFNNIKDWDEDNFHFQEKSRKEAIDEQRKWQKKRGEKLTKKYKVKNYTSLYMIGNWFRAIEKVEYSQRKSFLYGQIESASSYVFIEVLEKLEDIINTKYPSILAKPYGTAMFESIPNSKHSKLADYETRAAGKEKELLQAENILRNLHEKIENDVLDRIKPYSGYTFRKYSEGSKYDQLDNFIIGGFEAAKDISFKTFFHDFYKRRQPVEVLDNLIIELTEKYKTYLF